MSLTLTQIEQEVELLPQHEKLSLLEHLQKSYASDQEDLDILWVKESNSRYLSLKNGSSKATPMQHAISEIREELDKKR